MDQNFNEEGTTRTGCFSEVESNKQFVNTPICPKCHSNRYTKSDLGYLNCRCLDCGHVYNFNFNT